MMKQKSKGKIRKIVAIIQARMTSSRLPGKVLLDIAGLPMIIRVIHRLERSKYIDKILVATTKETNDDQIVEICKLYGYKCYRGSLNDVLDRCYQAARSEEADDVVRITADCPVIDHLLVDQTIDAFLGNNTTPGSFDFAANRLPPPFQRTYPIGLDTEVCTFTALEQAWKMSDQPYQREHVMPFLYEDIKLVNKYENKNAPGTLDVYQSPRGFRVLYLNHSQDFGTMRWTVDTAEDLELVRVIFNHFGNQDTFTWQEVVEFMSTHPSLANLNRSVYHKNFHESDPVS